MDLILTEVSDKHWAPRAQSSFLHEDNDARRTEGFIAVSEEREPEEGSKDREDIPQPGHQPWDSEQEGWASLGAGLLSLLSLCTFFSPHSGQCGRDFASRLYQMK